jgi:hypothetical protein
MPKKNRLVRTHQELATESNVLSYEFSQLCDSADLLRKGTFGGVGVTHNNTVQGFVSAFRNVACFFYPHHTNDFPQLRNDDLGAEEYLADWPTRCPVPSQYLRHAKKAADRHVMHMTAARRNVNFVRGIEHLWSIDVIEGELLGTLRIFLGAVPTTLVDFTALVKLGSMAHRIPMSASEVISHTGHTSVASAPGSDDTPTAKRTPSSIVGCYVKTQP